LSRSVKSRLDSLLVKRGDARTIPEAQALILEGRVRAWTGDKPVPNLKPGLALRPDARFEIIPARPYVSRAGGKLAGALDGFGLDPAGKVCLDAGVSTGGFTDCLLQRGAAKVYAVDVGYGQADPKIRSDPRVALFERTHILRWEPPWDGPAGGAPTLAVIDLSFISLKTVLERIRAIIAPRSDILALVKPQFEVEPGLLRKGVVMDESARLLAIEDVMAFSRETGLAISGRMPSPIEGAKGNREEWLRLVT